MLSGAAHSGDECGARPGMFVPSAARPGPISGRFRRAGEGIGLAVQTRWAGMGRCGGPMRAGSFVIGAPGMSRSSSSAPGQALNPLRTAAGTKGQALEGAISVQGPALAKDPQMSPEATGFGLIGMRPGLDASTEQHCRPVAFLGHGGSTSTRLPTWISVRRCASRFRSARRSRALPRPSHQPHVREQNCASRPDNRLPRGPCADAPRQTRWQAIEG
jgi:hypothetical protein